MKITKRQLRRIIKEEKAKILAENRIRRTARSRFLLESPAAMQDLVYMMRMEGGNASYAYELGHDEIYSIMMKHGITEWPQQREMVRTAAAQVNVDDSILDAVLDGLRDR